MQKYKLTYPQKNIWLVDKFNKGLPINSIVGTVEIYKDFDEKICNEAINYVIKNNDAMRINIVDEEEVLQYVKEFKYKQFEVVKLEMYSDEEKSEYINNCVLLPLLLEKNNLYEFKILDYGKGRGAIFMKIHHIISDAWSCGKIGTSLIDYMEKKSNGEEIEEELKPSYIEFIQKEEEYEKSEKFIKDENFWNEYLEGIKEPTLIKDKSSNVSTKSKRYNKKLDYDINKKINEYCRENKISPYVLFLTALSTYIYRIRDNKDIVLGTPVLNRSNFKEKDMLGMFISTLPIRIQIDEDIKFLDLAKKVATNTLTLFRHQKYPYYKTLEYVHKETDIKDNLYNIILSYQNARTNVIDKEKYGTTWPFVGHLNDQLQMHIMDMDNTGILNINYDYQTDIFSDVEIEYLHTRIMAIIENAINDINVNVENVEIMSIEEKNKILKEFNNTDKKINKEKSFVELFEEQVEKNPNNIALVFEDKKMTYDELNKKSNQLANYLKGKKIGRNDIVAFIMNRSFDIIVSILGILKSGAAYLPIDPDFPDSRINYMLDNSKSKIILVSNNKLDKGIKGNIVNIHNINTKDKSFETNLNINVLPDDLFFILYTSGSTGRPKGVQVMNYNIINLANYFKNHEIYTQTKVAVSLTTISFDIFVFESLISLLNGVELVIANEEEQKNPNKLNQLIYKYNIDLLQMTPTRFKLLINNLENIPFIKNVRNIVLAGEPLSLSLKNKVSSWNLNVYNGYGPTEATVFSSFTNCTTENRISIGKPIDNTCFYILDTKKRLLPLGIKGELYIGGSGVSKGYLNNQELTNKSFEIINGKRLYKSGDICNIGFDLKAYCFGRIDNQIKIRGLRIEASEIQEVIRKEAKVKECVVVKKIHEKKEYLVAFITSDTFIDTHILRKNISRILPLYMVPNKILNIKEMPYTPNGKIDIKKLTTSEKYVNYEEIKNKNVIKPTNDVQLDIYNYVSRISVANTDISIDDNFFEIGLDSLNIMELLVYINNKYDVELKVVDFIENPNILEISKIIENNKSLLKIEKNNIEKNRLFDECYNLTKSQLRIFSTYTSNPNSIVYNMPIEVKLNKNVDCQKLEKCIEEVINNHDAFSMILRVVDSNIAFVSLNDKIKLNCINENVLDERYQKIREKFLRPFDLLNEKLYRVEIYKTEKNVYVLFDIHHIICDGISLDMFFNEIIRKYNGITINDKIGSFKKYLLEKSNTKKYDKEYKEAKIFFNKMFKNLDFSTYIKPDYKRKEVRTYNGNKIGIKLKEELSNKINEYVLNNKLTYNTLFLSMLNILLSKYTFKRDVVIGMATMRRNYLKENNTIGMFVETLPYKSYINYEESAKSYLENVKKDIFNLINNDVYPIDELINDLSISKVNNRNAIFDIMYVYQNNGLPELVLEDEKVEYNILLNNISKFDITFEVIPCNGNFKINIEYNTDLYKKETIENLLNVYINLIENLLNFPIDKELSCFKIISKKEEEYILNKVNNTINSKKNMYKKNINKIFEDVVNKNLNKTAIFCYNKILTYKELNEKANQIAHMLKERKIGKNDVVALMLDKSIELMPGILGILKSGATYLPIDYELPDNRIKYMLENSNAKLIITKENVYKKVSNIPYICIDFDNNLLYDKYSTENLKLNISEKDTAYIIYTSGSTGKPKGVMIPHKGVVRLVKDTNYIHINRTDRVLLSGTIVFDASVFEMWLAMLNGLTLYIINKDTLLNPTEFEQYINENKITIALLTTSLFNQLVFYKKDLFKNFRYLVSGGDVMNVKSAEDVKINSRNLKLLNAYGPTENTVISSVYEYECNKDDKKVPIGKPILNSSCYIVDEFSNLLPRNFRGELIVGGEGVANGYINNSELTNEKFYKPNFSNTICYKTGDLVEFDFDYNINFIGRVDNQIKIRGYRIELDEIKTALLSVEKIKDVYINIIDNIDGKSEKLIFAYYVSDEELELDYLYEELKKMLPSYMLPNNIIRIDKIPLTINGKVDKTKLPIQLMNKKRDIILPRNDIERKIYNIWQELLPNIEISINDDFFKIGGDSLLATQFITKSMLNGLNYTYSDIYNYPTIMQLAESNETLLEEIYGISNYRYNKINELLKTKYYEKFDLKVVQNNDILLTGVTGFLGSHILADLIDNTNSKIYCIVRRKSDFSVKERIKEKLEFFFGNKYDKYIDNRIIIIEGDITKYNFGLKNEILNDIQNNVKTVIHSAAMVKHYGNYDSFVNLNINSTEKIADFCLLNNKRLIYISTLSNSGNMLESGQITQDNVKVETKYDEKSMYIGQKLYNVYVYSKYMGEYKILKRVLNGLEATIIRVGNLTGRYTDGKYQPNVDENAFANRIKSFISLGIVPQELVDMYVEYTPIDYAANAIVKISKLEKLPCVIHLFNHNHVYMLELIKILSNINVDLKVVSNEQFNKVIEEKLKENSEDIKGIIVDFNKNKELKYLSNIIVDSKYSIELLEKMNFKWPKISSEYIIRYLKYLESIGFIKLNNKEGSEK